MALRRPKIDPAEVAKLDAIRRARPPKTDVTGEHVAMLCALAKRLGLDHVELIEEWDERAAVREYDGEMSRHEAERLAAEDVRLAHEPQLGLGA